MDPERVACGECGEGMDWALQLLNDVHYRMGRYYEWKGEGARAFASYSKYLNNRAHGVGSLYPIEVAENSAARCALAQLRQGEASPEPDTSSKAAVES